MSDTTEKKHYISLMGNIGVGKSTGAQVIAEKKDYVLIPENFEDNPYWHDFYKDMKRWAYQTQSRFLYSKLHQLHQITQIVQTSENKGFVDDFSIYQDYAFALSHHKQGNISTRDWEIYKSLFDMLVPLVVQPSLLLLLYTRNIETNLKRIKNRGRESEKGIGVEYLSLLSNSFLSILDEVAKKIPVAKLDTEEIFFDKDPAHQEVLISFVDEQLKK